jgi:SCP-2 sterol transfer family
MATREQLQQCFETTLSRMHEQARHFRKWDKTMQYHFPDLGEDWFITLTSGEPGEPQQGVAQAAEIVYRMDSDTFVGIVDRSIPGLAAYKDGKVKLQASAMDMIKLQKLS